MASNTENTRGPDLETATAPFANGAPKDNGFDSGISQNRSRGSSNANHATSLDKVVIRGAFTLTDDGELQIGGNVEGNIKCHAMHVMENGTMSGDVNADSIIVKGTFNGNITTNHFTLASNAKVVSNDILVYDTVVIEPDSHFEGQLRRPNAQEAKDAKRGSENQRSNNGNRGNGRSDS